MVGHQFAGPEMPEVLSLGLLAAGYAAVALTTEPIE